jgi:tetratricopeptide (TPR) repeat protein
MAPTKPKNKSQKDRAKERLRAKNVPTQSPTVNARELLAKATALLEAGDAESAAKAARIAYESIGEKGRQAGAALSVLGQIHVELGDIDAARDFFAAAVRVDEDGLLPEDVGGGPEKFLWLAQLSEDGGRDSVTWFERGAAALRAEIQRLSEKLTSLPRTRDEQEAVINEKRRKLAETLCAVVEVYMTDLSWEEDAEKRCEALITEATMLAPEVAETWQTVANVRISQTRTEEAQEALKRSLSLWIDLPPEDLTIPPFPSRVSLVRLLTEVGMEENAIDVAERLVDEDDQSVEAWYLGGFSRYILGEKLKGKPQPLDAEGWKKIWRSSRRWLAQCLRIYDLEEYEDERLQTHTKELLELIKNELGEAAEGDDEIWEDTDDDEGDHDDSDEDMQ